MKKTFLLFWFLLGSCGKSAPEWYLKTPENNSSTIYGVGASTNKEQAIEEALSNMKERIYTSVSSSKFIQDIAINKEITNEYKSNVKLQTPNVPIPNYKVEEIQETGKNTYIIVAASRAEVAESINKILENNASKIRPYFMRFHDTLDIVEKVFIIDDLYEKCTKHFEIERFYNGLGFIYPDNICTEVYKTSYNLRPELPVQVVNSDIKVLPILIAVFEKKLNIDENSKRTVSYSTQFKTEQEGGSFITGLTLNIMQYNVPKVYTKKCVGNSSVSKGKSIDAAIAACLEKAQKQSFEEFFRQ